MHDLKERTIRGGAARLASQVASLALRTVALVVLARLLDPKDFGLVGMVTAFTGILTWFRDFGLSAAAVQRVDITADQHSTLFWINVLFGALLMLVTVAAAPAIAAFYHQPGLLWVTVVLGTAFLFNAVGIQHSALLQRQMRFTAMAAISLASLMAGTAVAIAGAAIGYGYWALVASLVITPLVASIGFWLATGWVPGAPRRRAGIRSMMHFGGTLTLNGIVAYVGFNADKVMIGRFLGVDAVGIYGRGFQLINMPIDNLNAAVGEVAFSALSRVQNDPVRLRSYFLKGFSFVLGLTLPVTIACALFADDLVLVLLGPKWRAATEIVRLLAPTIAVMAVINPMGWLISSLGLVRRSLKIALVFSPLMILGCLMGLPYGVTGVAFAYSAVMVLWVVPHVAWCVHGTAISLRDVAATVFRPLASGVVAGAAGYAAHLMCGDLLPPLLRLVLESGVLVVTFFAVLVFVAGQKALYVDLLRGLSRGRAAEDYASTPA
ncbi:MAG TPA: lipopolysaccharide biosynthesis protein [Roseiarcus sp.]|jgi:O-antigen/teichoic acid export membrane protein|nr:lipopolysaccharide biosynthesis protein [Roseiarcus sp.]